MALSTIAGLAGSALSTITKWTGSAVVGELVSTGFSYLSDGKLPADSKAELNRLLRALPQITAVIGIAEALKMKHPDAREWVEQFRQAVEASEDVLDELEYKRLEDMVKNQDEAGGSASSSKKRKICIINDDTLERLKEAVKLLDQAAIGVGRLLQLSTVLDIHGLSVSQQEVDEVSRRETTSFLAEREMFGREVEKHKIIDWLQRPTDAHLSSFGIVGMGGQGKTTLVQFAYQEMHRLNHFDKTIWVCVSTNFRVEDVTRKMLSELGENSCGKPLNALQETLKEKIHSKKVLIILDDVWDDKRRNWEQLIAPLRFVQQSSKILFTTRMKSVADLLASVISTEHESLALQDLGEQELRLLFYSYAFYGSNPDNHRDLYQFGDQILKMLRGSPLAAKVIGNLLNSRMNHQYWRRILNHGSLFKLEEAKDVMEVLKFSYYYLPADLQVCFRFCSIFPQDHQFIKDELIKMWIASGFLSQQSRQEERLEDIGEDYFNLLLRKSFFERYVVHDWWWKDESDERYVMHDLLHELAQNISYGECCTIESNNTIIPSTVRHVSIHDSEIDRVSNLGNLRSLIIFSSSNRNSLVLPNNLIKKPLRLLKIEGYHTLELPKEINCLVHLRYLSIKLRNITQPFKYPLLTSISTLYHLQVLKFQIYRDDSSYLGIETTGMSNLLRLRYMRLPKEILQSIHGIHKLTSLQELTFFVGKDSGYCIKELGTLNNLRHLSIHNIENVKNYADAKSANILGKNNLMSLSLTWTTESNTDNSEQIIDYLQPHPKLMKLTIWNYNGQRSPKWMEESPPLNISSLRLYNCPLWKNQLSSWKMPYLKILEISDCLNLDKLPDMPLSLTIFCICNVGLSALPEYYQSSDSSGDPIASSLRIVLMKYCQNLTSLSGLLRQQDNMDFHSLNEISVISCENLIHLPMGAFGKFVSLQRLTISDCPMLMAIDNHSTLLPMALKYLSIENCGKLDEPLLESASRLPTLTDLRIGNCANISRIPSSENAFESLNVLHIKRSKKLVEHSSREQAHGADRRSSLASLKIKELHIDNLSLLLIEPLRNLSFVSYLSVSDCSWMEALLEQWFLQNSNTLKRLTLWDVGTLNTLPATMVRLTMLEVLTINGADLLEELPELPASLRKLSICDARSLKSLPATMARLTALENLKISKADLLENLPSYQLL